MLDTVSESRMMLSSSSKRRLKSSGAPRLPTTCDANWMAEDVGAVVVLFAPSRYTWRRCRMKWQMVTLRKLVIVLGLGEEML